MTSPHDKLVQGRRGLGADAESGGEESGDRLGRAFVAQAVDELGLDEEAPAAIPLDGPDALVAASGQIVLAEVDADLDVAVFGHLRGRAGLR